MSEKEIDYKARAREWLNRVGLMDDKIELLFAASIPFDDIPPDLRMPLQEWLVAQLGGEPAGAIISWRRVCELFEREYKRRRAEDAERPALLRRAPCGLIQRAESFVDKLEGQEMPDVLPDDFEDTLAHKRHNYTNYDDVLYECFSADESVHCGIVWKDKEEAEQWCCQLNDCEDSGNIEIVFCPVNEEAYMIVKSAANNLVRGLNSRWRERDRARKGR